MLTPTLIADSIIDSMTGWTSDLARWTAFLAATGVSDVTIRTYRRTLVNFVADTLIEPNDASEDDLVEYLAGQSAKGHARAMTIRTFRSYYGWAARRRLGVPNPAGELRTNSPKYGPAGFLTEDELVRVLVAAADRDPRRAWAILLLYATGIRLGSLVAIRPEDVRGDVLFLRVAKGNRPYAVPLGPVGMAAVAGLMDGAGDMLVGVGGGRMWEWVHQAGMDAGVRVYPHLLRHTWAKVQVERNVHPRVIQELGNWADLSQLTRYAHVADPQKRAAAI